MNETAAAPPLSGPAARAQVLYLASASAARVELLRRAGVAFTQEPAAIDEAEIRSALRGEGATAAQAAESLAELKARKVSEHRPAALVVGADQILECGGAWFDKPADRDHALAQLRALRGRSHLLISSTCVVRDAEPVWHQTETAELVMRPFTDAFLDAYLDAVGDTALQSVGAYQLEGLGAQLFSRVRGDYFTILGLPLLPLLEFLRQHGLVST
jgi:septum formation protein